MQIKSAIQAMPLKTLSVFFAALVLVTSPQVASSQELQLKVQTRMPYAENNDQGDRRRLVHQFKKDAFKKMMSDPNTPLAKARLIEQYFDEMTDYEMVDRFFTKYVFAGKCDTGS
jgi:type II restriction/modification system DNA methylase subunit YeeA